ncbi:metalloproteinase inhibitor 2-like [Chiloscyllium punctatum]|uniref:metalloproteinase inhibitor 2-like n=1 Tax=Chiloscyllium punctatum TaxID=137246 RepID=UPI003B63D2C3
MSCSICHALGLLFLLSVRWGAEACSCGPTHPQQAYCQADVVIKGKIVSSKIITLGNSSDTNPQQWIQYEVEQDKMYKGSEKIERVREVYTPRGDFVCGMVLGPDQMDEAYVLSGTMGSDGKIFINICGLNKAWRELTPAQQLSLDGSYEAGCQCTVVPCLWLPCKAANDQCLWTDGVLNGNWLGAQTQRFTCRMKASGLCQWVSAKVARARARAGQDNQ